MYVFEREKHFKCAWKEWAEKQQRMNELANEVFRNVLWIVSWVFLCLALPWQQTNCIWHKLLILRQIIQFFIFISSGIASKLNAFPSMLARDFPSNIFCPQLISGMEKLSLYITFVSFTTFFCSILFSFKKTCLEMTSELIENFIHLSRRRRQSRKCFFDSQIQ